MPAISWPSLPLAGDAAAAAGALLSSAVERAPRDEPPAFNRVMEQIAAQRDVRLTDASRLP